MKPEPIELLPKNTYYLYRRRANKTEYWRKGKVMFAYRNPPIHQADHNRVAFFNNDVGARFDIPQHVLKMIDQPVKKKVKKSR